jgi:hypothetical protein
MTIFSFLRVRFEIKITAILTLYDIISQDLYSVNIALSIITKISSKAKTHLKKGVFLSFVLLGFLVQGMLFAVSAVFFQLQSFFDDFLILLRIIIGLFADSAFQLD